MRANTHCVTYFSLDSTWFPRHNWARSFCRVFSYARTMFFCISKCTHLCTSFPSAQSSAQVDAAFLVRVMFFINKALQIVLLVHQRFCLKHTYLRARRNSASCVHRPLRLHQLCSNWLQLRRKMHNNKPPLAVGEVFVRTRGCTRCRRKGHTAGTNWWLFKSN